LAVESGRNSSRRVAALAYVTDLGEHAVLGRVGLNVLAVRAGTDIGMRFRLRTSDTENQIDTAVALLTVATLGARPAGVARKRQTPSGLLPVPPYKRSSGATARTPNSAKSGK
jgi:hypothetical protein